MWKSHGRACVTDATIDCYNKHVTPSMLFPCHLSPDKTAFTFLSTEPQSCSTCPLFLFHCLCYCSYSFFTDSYTLYFLPNPAITLLFLLPNIFPSSFQSRKQSLSSCRVDMKVVRPQCHLLIIKKISSLFFLTVQ